MTEHNIIISGPYERFYYPYDKPAMPHTIWYVRYEDQILEIKQYRGQERYIVPATWPIVEDTSFDNLVDRWLNGEEWTYCS